MSVPTDHTKPVLLPDADALQGRVVASNGEAPRQRAESDPSQALMQVSEVRYRILADHSPDWEYWLGPDRRFEYVSPACEAISGYPPAAFLADPELFCRLLHPDDRAAWHAHLHETAASEQGTHDNLLLRLIVRDGTVQWLEHQCAVVFHEGFYLGRRGVNRNVTRRVLAEAEASHVSRLLKTLSEVNQFITREQNETVLIQQVCRVAVEIGGLKASLAAMLDDASGQLWAHAWSGPGADVLEGWLPSLDGDDVVLPQGVRQSMNVPLPCDIAAAADQPDPVAAWCAWLRTNGVGAVIHFPLQRDGGTIGLMSFFADSLDFLRPDVCDLLRELAGDLSFALASFSHRRQEFAARYKLADREAYLRTMMQTLPLGVGVVVGRVFTELNQGVCDMLGYAADALLGQSSRMIYPDDDEYLRVGREKYAEMARSGRGGIETRWRRKDGGIIDVHLISSAFDAGDLGKGVVFTAEDISERKRAEENIRLLARAIESMAEGVTITDATANIVSVNRAFSKMTGYSEAEVVGKKPRMLQSPRHDDAFFDAMWATLRETGRWQGELWNRKKSGEEFPVWMTISSVNDERGRVSNYVAVVGDISALKQSQDQLDFLSHYDALTHLPNRELLYDRLEHAIQRVRREGEQLAVLMLDLDRFKTINESLGHSVGDALLKAVAARMQGQMRGGDTLARVGGDEFILLLENDVSAHSASLVALKWLELIVQPVQIGETGLAVTASIGISLFPANGDTADDLLRHADTALYKAKGQGRNNFQFYEQEMTAGAFEHLLLENALRGAVSRNELRVHYQPQVDFISGELRGVEALVRWFHPELGVIAPGRFIPLAEEAGIIGMIGEWVLREACRQMVAWDGAGLRIPCVAVNLSVQQIERDTLAPMVAEVLASSGLDGARLELEVTESMIMHETDRALLVLQDLRELGVKLAIDDFGTGYSSLSYLRRLPMHRLKIDQSFVRDIGRDSNGEAIVRAIIALGRSLGLETVAEGVEQQDQANFLRTEACDIGQGFLYSRPVAADEINRQWGAERHLAPNRPPA